MSTPPEAATRLHFACTSCGKCCDRSPEVLLSEAADLADTFVFRLMFRLYVLPSAYSGRSGGSGSAASFYESRRLLNAFAARKSTARVGGGANAAEHVKYLLISALSLDTGSGSCAALNRNRCGIYERRPLACRSVPFHYSRPEASAANDLAAFTARPGYRCDTSANAPLIIEQGRIVDGAARRARDDALEQSARDRDWQNAIMRRLKSEPERHGLPSLMEIHANAPLGVTTVSMRVAWRIAAEAGLIDSATYRDLIAAQSALIDRELATTRCSSTARTTLFEMRAEGLADDPPFLARAAAPSSRNRSTNNTRGNAQPRRL